MAELMGSGRRVAADDERVVGIFRRKNWKSRFLSIKIEYFRAQHETDDNLDICDASGNPASQSGFRRRHQRRRARDEESGDREDRLDQNSDITAEGDEAVNVNIRKVDELIHIMHAYAPSRSKRGGGRNVAFRGRMIIAALERTPVAGTTLKISTSAVTGLPRPSAKVLPSFERGMWNVQ